jgi:uncharacterized protein YbjT (DUF2867 family)
MIDAPILLIGGTRGTGLLIARLLQHQGVAIRVLARDPARAIRELGPAAEVIAGDITREPTLHPAIVGTRHIIFTAGRRSGRPVGREQVRRTEYDGVLNTLTAASRVGFAGRFLYMTSSGVGARSFWTFALNLYKGNTLVWRERAERAIRASSLPYTIIRTGVLTNRAGGQRTIELTQRPLPLSPRYRIARADVAAAFVAALQHPRTARATFDIVWGTGTVAPRWSDLFERVLPDDASQDRIPNERDH